MREKEETNESMESICIHTVPAYEALIGAGILGRAGELTARAVTGRRVMIVSDERVAPLYLEGVRASYAAAGFDTAAFLLPAGEGGKTLAALGRLLNAAAEADMTRGDLFAALGGGVVGDLTGFAAAVYLRGVDFVQLPTTLLAMVDAAVGGKTAVNLDGGKNLCGAFHQPRLVLCDPAVLASLEAPVYAEGMAEVIKNGAICDGALLDKVARGAPAAELIADCIRIKGDFVSRDERDQGPRRLLNFGHTFGHALEKLSGYTLYHGEGVAVGMLMAAWAAENHGLCAPGVYAELRGLIAAQGLPVTTPFASARIAEQAMRDKKHQGGALTLVLPAERGRCVLHPLPVEELAGFIACCDGQVSDR